jgi:manganese/zinc/iron transport system substrate-binding protein
MLTRRSLLRLMGASTLPFAMLGRGDAADPPKLVATTGMIADAARRISGLPVTALMGPGLDPHGHRATRNDILALSRADLVLWHGLNLEAQMERLMTELAKRKPVVAVAESLDRALLLANLLRN